MGLVGSRPDGYDRGSVRRDLEREDVEDAIEGAISLLPVVEVEKLVEVENVDATERRDDRMDELDDVVYDEAEAIELRFESMTCWNILSTT